MDIINVTGDPRYLQCTDPRHLLGLYNRLYLLGLYNQRCSWFMGLINRGNEEIVCFYLSGNWQRKLHQGSSVFWELSPREIDRTLLLMKTIFFNWECFLFFFLRIRRYRNNRDKHFCQQSMLSPMSGFWWPRILCVQRFGKYLSTHIDVSRE